MVRSSLGAHQISNHANNCTSIHFLYPYLRLLIFAQPTEVVLRTHLPVLCRQITNMYIQGQSHSGKFMFVL
jgi:hypothetical protein